MPKSCDGNKQCKSSFERFIFFCLSYSTTETSIYFNLYIEKYVIHTNMYLYKYLYINIYCSYGLYILLVLKSVGKSLSGKINLFLSGVPLLWCIFCDGDPAKIQLIKHISTFFIVPWLVDFRAFPVLDQSTLFAFVYLLYAVICSLELRTFNSSELFTFSRSLIDTWPSFVFFCKSSIAGIGVPLLMSQTCFAACLHFLSKLFESWRLRPIGIQIHMKKTQKHTHTHTHTHTQA